MRKFLGVVLVIIGIISVFTPFTPFGWVGILGLELLGLRLVFQEKISKLWHHIYKK
jgi:hypothetical protein